VRHLLLAVQLLIEINKVVLTCRDVWGWKKMARQIVLLISM
jgi:hypothetical protein